jgi:hypothetical protein
MQVDKTFLARLLDIPESEIEDIKGGTFVLANVGLIRQHTFEGLLVDRFSKKMEALSKVLSKEDDLGVVIRAHIHIEHELYDFMYFAAPSPDQLKDVDEIPFRQKVDVALVLGLNATLKPALNAVGKLRNDFAHRLNTIVDEQRVSDLIRKLSPSSKQSFDEIFRRSFSAGDLEEVREEQKSLFRRRTRLDAFFLTLLLEVAKERQRMAFAKLESTDWQ